MKIEITIKRNAEGALDVWQGDRHSNELCVGEMIELSLKLLGLMPGQTYAMLTDAQWATRFPKLKTTEDQNQ